MASYFRDLQFLDIVTHGIEQNYVPDSSLEMESRKKIEVPLSLWACLNGFLFNHHRPKAMSLTHAIWGTFKIKTIIYLPLMMEWVSYLLKISGKF